MVLNPICKTHFYNCENTLYRGYLHACIKAIEPLLTKKQKRALIDNKLQFKRKDFDVDQYIQSACELSVITRMYVDFTDDFEYEPKKNTNDEKHKNKDVDFAFSFDFLKVNVEVKCFNRVNYNQIQNESDFHQSHFNINGKKSRFLPLKDFFVKSNEKFGKQSDCEVNVLFVCCYDIDDYIDVSNSLGGKTGVCFRKNNKNNMDDCILDVDNFEKIDAVIVSNVAFHHENFNRTNEGNFLNPWDFCETFTMGFVVHEKARGPLWSIISQMIKQAFNIQNDRYLMYCKNENLDRFDYGVSLRKFIDHMNDDLGGYYFIKES